jgi:hypothetical protein
MSRDPGFQPTLIDEMKDGAVVAWSRRYRTKTNLGT